MKITIIWALGIGFLFNLISFFLSKQGPSNTYPLGAGGQGIQYGWPYSQWTYLQNDSQLMFKVFIINWIIWSLISVLILGGIYYFIKLRS